MLNVVVRARPLFGLRRVAGAVAAVGLLTALLVGPATAAIGGQLFWNGGTVTVDVQYADAGLTSKLYLYPNYTDATPDFSGAIYIADNCNSSPAACTGLPSIPVTIPGSLGAGDELVFGIEVQGPGDRFLIGPGTRNSDGLAHANVTPIGSNGAQVGFEDLLGGGDNDFNDNLFNFTAVVVNHPPTSDAGDDVAGDEGSAIALDGSAGGADVGETLTPTWSFLPGAGVDGGASCSFADATDPTTTITCTDDGMYTATLTVGDGTYTVTDDVIVTVGNANPAVSASFAANAVSCGTAGSLTVAFTDAGSNDTHSASVHWGDGSAAQSVASITTGTVLTHTYALAGSYNAQVTVTDDDLGAGSDNSNAIATNFTVVGGGVQQPINQTGPMSIFKSKSTIPVKISYLDCNGAPATNLAPTIKVNKISGGIPSGVDEPIVSTSNADTGQTMRVAGNGYIYNLAAQSLTDTSATYRLTITVPATGQTTTVDFGLKP
jgi:PKD domain-containing protein/uncharacterized protein DUF4114